MPRTPSILAVSISAPDGEGNGVRLYDRRGETPSALDAPRRRPRPIHRADLGREMSILSPLSRPSTTRTASPAMPRSGSGRARVRRAGWRRRTMRPRGSPCRRPTSSRGAGMGRGCSSGSSRFRTRTTDDGRTDTDADNGDGEGEGEEEPSFDPYDVEAILEDRGVDVWHWKDPRIIPNQKERWEEFEKDRVYRAVVHLEDGRVVAAGRSRDARGRTHRQPAVRPRSIRSSLPQRDHLGWAVRRSLRRRSQNRRTSIGGPACRRRMGRPDRFAVARRRLHPVLRRRRLAPLRHRDRRRPAT